jgi:hypothetical protein
MLVTSCHHQLGAVSQKKDKSFYVKISNMRYFLAQNDKDGIMHLIATTMNVV